MTRACGSLKLASSHPSAGNPLKAHAPLVLASSLLLLAPLALAEARVEAEPYVWAPSSLNFSVGAFGPFVGFSSMCDGNVAGACFALEPGDAAVAIEARDATGLPVSAGYTFLDADGAFLAVAGFCGATAAAVPEGAVQLAVGVGWYECDVAAGPVALENVAFVATTGEIVASFSG